MRTQPYYRYVCALPISIIIAVASASGQGYPNKPVRIVTSEAGGSVDLTARLVAQGLTNTWGQQVIVDNRAGNVNIQAGIVGKSPADGHTLLAFSNAFWLMPYLRETPYDPLKDFSTVTMAMLSPNVLVVNPTLPIKSVTELISLAKAKPGTLNFGSGPTGTITHLCAELFKTMAGVNIIRVSYKGTAPAVSDLIAGQIQLMFSTPTAVIPHIKSSRLRALAVTSAEQSPMIPDLPTVAASGVPGYEAVLMSGFFAPANTPAAITNQLNQESIKVLNSAAVKDKLFGAGVQVVANSPDAAVGMIKAEMARMGKAIKDAGIHEE